MTNNQDKCDTDRPLERALCEKFNRAGEGKIPKDLQGIPGVTGLEPIKFERIPYEKIADLSNEPIDHFIPDWADVLVKPTAALRQSGYRRELRLRGKQVDPLVVLGTDERRTYNDRSYPWGCICRIVTSAGTGSGVIVGPRHVLTASHVVDWSVPGGVSGVVEVHRAGPEVAAVSPIRRVTAFTRVTGSVGWTELDEDYAVLETADPIGERFGWLGTRTYSSSWDDEPYWYNLGYPGDLGGARWPTWQRSKWLDEHAWDFGSGRAMDTNADLNPGNSGGPMFAWWSDGPYVVAVVSAHDPEDNENYCSGGRDLPRLVRAARGI